MPVEDEFYYWMNVIMAMVPGTDYPLLAKLLPWCMKQTGFEEWLPVLEAAVQETRIAETEAEGIPDGCFAVRCEVPESLREHSDQLILTFLDRDWKVAANAWPDARTGSFLYFLEAGEYQVMLEAPGADEEAAVTRRVLAGDHWVCIDADTPFPENILFTYEEGCAYELPTDGLV